MGWLIALAVLTVLAVLPLGVSASYDEVGFFLKVIAGPVRIQLLPAKKKEKKPKKEKPKKKTASAPAQTKAEPKQGKKGGSLKDFLPLIQVALDLLSDFRRKLRVNVLQAKVILAGDDPADLAINYGRAWTALGNLWPRLEEFLVIQKRDVQIECDFTSNETRIWARLDLTITLGRLTVLGVVYGIRALKEFMKLRKQSKGGATI